MTDRAGLSTNERSTGRDNKKEAGKRRGRHVKPSLYAASASGRSVLAAFPEAQQTREASALLAPGEHGANRPAPNPARRVLSALR